ncbi:MAG TPA: alanine--tRNA ligase, partial [Gammaproteobacteria bacterium]|nr:alanine--tRNA ligase [Gammaproteobacteria bacterium]
EAIGYAWEFLTEVMKLPEERLWVTVFEEDDEAADIWLKEIGVSPERFGRIGAKDNFWSMGDTGPCGPCSEIFYDHGPDVPGGPPGSPDEDGDRYIEIWNLVFMQYDRHADGTLTPLPKPSVDTGMGLERLAAVMQGVHSNYEIDLFARLIRAIAVLVECDDPDNNSLKVIADHIRSCSFLIVDGVMPSNEGRGYVLRRIIRRAIRHGHKLGMREAFFHKLVAPLADEMGDAFPELIKAQAQVERVLANEEEQFARTLDQGMQILEAAIADLRGTEIPGDTVFKLYDTYGFPVDLTADIARERGLTLDMVGFEAAMAEQRERARAASSFKTAVATGVVDVDEAEFTGYEHLHDTATIQAIVVGDEARDELAAGEEGAIYLDRTPFYAESGGQVGDRGRLYNDDAEFEVRDTQKPHAHIGYLKQGRLRVGDRMRCEVDEAARAATARNHSATHLLHAALREILGEHVTQKGSLVEPERLRFDFSHFEPVTPEELRRIEARVNEQIRANNPVRTEVMDMDAALQRGAMALFGEKYDQQVRVLSMGEFSVELCGGTHVKRTGDIGLFKIIGEAGVAAGVRRIEAVTGEAALAWLDAAETALQHIAGLLRSSREDVEDKVSALLARNRQLEKELEQLKGKLASSQGSDLAEQAEEIDGVRVLAARLDGADNKTLRETLDQLKNKLGSAAVVLAAVSGDKVTLVAGVTPDQTKRIKAGELVNVVARQVGGKGGGRPDMAQAGGKDPAKLDAALASVGEWVRQQLSH